jgi:hypothetical protein
MIQRPFLVGVGAIEMSVSKKIVASGVPLDQKGMAPE